MKVQSISRGIGILLLLLGGFLALGYGGSLQADFIYDDALIVRDNPAVQECSWGKIGSDPYWQEEGRGLFRPFTLAALCINRWLLGPSAWGFHLVNVLIHAFNVFLLFFLCLYHCARRKEGPWIPFFLTSLFALHPTLIEAVNGIVGRADLLVGSFIVLSYASLILGGKMRLLISLFWGLALLSKENGIMLPFVLLGLSVLAKGKEGKGWRPQNFLGWLKANRGLIFLCLVVVDFILIWRASVLDSFAPSSVKVGFSSLVERGLTPFQVLGLSLSKLLWPFSPQWDYSPIAMMPAKSFLNPQVLVCLGALVIVAGFAWRLKRSWPLLLLALFGVAMLPTLQIVPIGVIFAERFMYVPFLCLALGLSIVLKAPATKGTYRVVLVAAFSVLALFAMKLNALHAYWADDLKFWTYTQALAPQSYSANQNLGMAYKRRGDLVSAEKFLRQNILLAPNTSLTYGRWAEVLLELGREEEAEKGFRSMLALNSKDCSSWNHLGLLAQKRGERKESAEYFGKAATCEPRNETMGVNLALAYLDLGMVMEAEDETKRLEKLFPVSGRTKTLRAWLLFRQEKREELRTHLMRVDRESVSWKGDERRYLLNALHAMTGCGAKTDLQVPLVTWHAKECKQ